VVPKTCNQLARRPANNGVGRQRNQAKGSFEGPQQSSVIGANDQLLTSRDYRPLIIAYRNNAAVTLADVADVIDEAENVRQEAWMNDVPAVILNI
jgi:multidrug efflux pump